MWGIARFPAMAGSHKGEMTNGEEIAGFGAEGGGKRD
jgi:hypothetical protein